MISSGEIGIQIRVKPNNLGDIDVKFLNQRYVFDHVVRNSRLVILIHLLNQNSVSVQNGLNLSKAIVECCPNLVINFIFFVGVLVGGDCGIGGVFHVRSGSGE